MLDLFLGSDIGLWALNQTPTEWIKNVISIDDPIIQVAKDRDINVIDDNVNSVSYDNAESGISVHYPRIIRPHLIARYRSLYNIHPGFLPWGRGFYPVFWALWEETPAGATLHFITEGLDEGPIVEQIAVPYGNEDTGYSLLMRVRAAEMKLFNDYLPRIHNAEEFSSVEQARSGSYHSRRDFLDLKTGEAWQKLDAHDLLRLLRSLSFPGYSGIELRLGTQEYTLTLSPKVNREE